MPDRDLRELASYLVSCSSTSLGSFYLAKLDLRSHLERNLRELVRQLADVAAAAQLAELLHQHEEETIASDRALARQGRSVDQTAAAQPPMEPPRDTLRDWWPIHEHEAVRSSEMQLLMGIKKLLRHPLRPNGKDLQDPERFGWTEPTKYGEKTKHKSLTACKLSAAQEERQANSLFERKIIDKRGGGSHHGQQFRVRDEAQHEWKAERPPRIVGDKPAKPRCRPKMKISEEGCTFELNGKQLCTRERPKAVHTVLADGDNRFDLEDGSIVSIEMQDGSLIGAEELSPRTADLRTEEPARTANMRTEGSPESPLRTANMRTEDAAKPGARTAEMRTEETPPATFRRVPIMDDQGRPVCDPHFGALVVWVDDGKPLFQSQREDKWLKRPAVAIFNHFHGKGKGWLPKWETPPAQPKKHVPERERTVVASRPSRIWDQMLQQIESAPPSSPMHVNPHTFATWLRPTSEEGAMADGTLVIRVPSRPFRKRLSEALAEQISRAFATVTGESRPLLIKYVAQEEEDVVHEIVPPSGEPQATTNRKEHRAHA